jgi:hypothetical protein
MKNYPPEPTGDQCMARSVVEHDGVKYLATWYPQMGGYVGKCLVTLRDTGDCVEVYVWHDGEFPFSDSNPAVIHHCDIDQFRVFAEDVENAQATPDRIAIKAKAERQHIADMVNKRLIE